MQKRIISALVLMVYSALLIKAVVFKGLMGLPGAALMGPPGPPGLALTENPQLVLRAAPNRTDPANFVPSKTILPRRRPHHHHSPSSDVNFVPFKTILPQLRGEPRWSTALMNLVGNTALFVPVGFLVPLVYRKMTWQKSLALAVAVGLTMEGMEGVFRVGIVDVDDVLLNALGVMTGYWVFTFCERRRGNTAASARAMERPA